MANIVTRVYNAVAALTGIIDARQFDEVDNRVVMSDEELVELIPNPLGIQTFPMNNKLGIFMTARKSSSSPFEVYDLREVLRSQGAERIQIVPIPQLTISIDLVKNTTSCHLNNKTWETWPSTFSKGSAIITVYFPTGQVVNNIKIMPDGWVNPVILNVASPIESGLTISSSSGTFASGAQFSYGTVASSIKNMDNIHIIQMSGMTRVLVIPSICFTKKTAFIDASGAFNSNRLVEYDNKGTDKNLRIHTDGTTDGCYFNEISGTVSSLESKWASSSDTQPNNKFVLQNGITFEFLDSSNKALDLYASTLAPDTMVLRISNIGDSLASTDYRLNFSITSDKKLEAFTFNANLYRNYWIMPANFFWRSPSSVSGVHTDSNDSVVRINGLYFTKSGNIVSFPVGSKVRITIPGRDYKEFLFSTSTNEFSGNVGIPNSYRFSYTIE